MTRSFFALLALAFLSALPLRLSAEEPASDEQKIAVSVDALAGMDSTASRAGGFALKSSATVDFPSLFSVRASADFNLSYSGQSYFLGVQYTPLWPFTVKLGTARLYYSSLDSGYDFVEAALEARSELGFRLSIGWMYTSLNFNGYSAIYPFGTANGLSSTIYTLPTIAFSVPLLRLNAFDLDYAMYTKNILFCQAESMINAKLSAGYKINDTFTALATASAGVRGLSGLSFALESIRWEVGVRYAW